MNELRWNPLLGTWTMVSPARQGRPNLPQGQCPFCPGSGKVPDKFDVLAYPNDFPALSLEPPDLAPLRNGPYRSAQSYGRTEVILYSSDHEGSLATLSVPHIEKLVALWINRTKELEADRKIKYVFPFENRGPEVGATISHPHGQLYAYPFVPLKIETELEQCEAHFKKTASCLLCEMNSWEEREGTRVIFSNESLLAYLPYFTDYPFGIFVCMRRHLSSLVELLATEIRTFAEALHNIVGMFDELFKKPLPYMMCIHQTPANTERWASAADFYHLHVEFYPPLRSADRIKWYASSEMGAWAALNPRSIEETAEELRSALSRFKKGV